MIASAAQMTCNASSVTDGLVHALSFRVEVLDPWYVYYLKDFHLTAMGEITMQQRTIRLALD